VLAERALTARGDPVASDQSFLSPGFASIHKGGARHFSFFRGTIVGPGRRGAHGGAVLIQYAHDGDRCGVGAAVVSDFIKIDRAENLLRAVADAGVGTRHGLAIQPVRPVARLRVSDQGAKRSSKLSPDRIPPAACAPARGDRCSSCSRCEIVPRHVGRTDVDAAVGGDVLRVIHPRVAGIVAAAASSAVPTRNDELFDLELTGAHIVSSYAARGRSASRTYSAIDGSFPPRPPVRHPSGANATEEQERSGGSIPGDGFRHPSRKTATPSCSLDRGAMRRQK
jgi:hypothetical protein